MIALKVGCDFQWKYQTTGVHLAEKRLAAPRLTSPWHTIIC